MVIGDASWWLLHFILKVKTNIQRGFLTNAIKNNIWKIVRFFSEKNLFVESQHSRTRLARFTERTT